MAAEILIDWLRETVKRGGTDLYLTCDSSPMARTDRGLEAVDDDILDDAYMARLIDDITTSQQQGEFWRTHEFNLAIDLGRDIGRFRVNLMQQRQHPMIVLRTISSKVPSMEELKLPILLGELAREKRGLVIVVGATGSGKSTSLAAMIDWRNRHDEGHILTIEDPIEYTHRHKKSLVTQREVGTDTDSFQAALKNALRQKPDCILIGEIRDREVMRHALNIAETGHLALATLHANNADQAIDRMANFFDPDERRQALLNLSFNLKGILSQRLIRSAEGGRVLAIEIMLNMLGVTKLVRTGDTSLLKDQMRAGEHLGMQTFDKCIEGLYREGKISRQVALAESDDRLWMRQTIGEDDE